MRQNSFLRNWKSTKRILVSIWEVDGCRNCSVQGNRHSCILKQVALHLLMDKNIYTNAQSKTTLNQKNNMKTQCLDARSDSRRTKTLLHEHYQRARSSFFPSRQLKRVKDVLLRQNVKMLLRSHPALCVSFPKARIHPATPLNI